MKRRSFLGTLSAGAAAALAGGPGSASPGAAKPPEPKVFFYDDGRHASALYQFAPPLSPDDLYLAVDQLVDSGVDTLIYSAGLEGGAVQYDSKVGQKWGDNVPMWVHPIFYRASRNLHQLIADGHDPLKLLCDPCHEKGLRSSGGIRRSACGSSYTMWICPSSSARIATSKSSRSAIDPPMVDPMKMRRGQISESRPQAHATGRGSAHSRPSGPARHSALRGLEGTPQRFTRPGFPFWPSWSVYDSRLPAAMQRFSHCCQVRYSFRCRSGLRMLADHGVPAKPEGPLATPLPRRPSATRVRWLFRAVDVTLRAQVAPKSAAACRRTTSGSDAPPQAATNNIARASRAVRPSSSADAASSSATSF